MSQDYYAVLARTVAEAGRDHAHLRMMVYNLARSELRKELEFATVADTMQQVSALEAAIKRLESDIVDYTKLLGSSSSGPFPRQAAIGSTAGALAYGQDSREVQTSRELAVATSGAVEVLPPIVSISPYDSIERWRLSALAAADIALNRPQPIGAIHRAFWWRLQLLLATLLGMMIFVVAPTPGDFLNLLAPHARDAPVTTAEVPAPKVPPPPPKPRNIGFAIPDTYGVYALSHGGLADLHTLPIHIPDPRVAISGVFSKPSETTLTDGQLQFVVFRRDLVNDAPDRAAVRVVAQVVRALTFQAGKAKTVAVEGSWAVRSNAYEMAVAPIEGYPEMVMIRPEDPGFSFPAGRYALVIKNQAYDFTVAGPITDPAHCLERTDALTMPVYNECRTP